MTMDRWGDSTHKMSAYNNRYHPSNRDQRQIDRMKRETMVLYPTLHPNPVLPKKHPGFSGDPGVFPRGPGGLKRLNWRAEGLRVQPPMNQSQAEEEEPSMSDPDGVVVLPQSFSFELVTAKMGGIPRRGPTTRLAALDAGRIPNRKGTSRCV